MPRSRMVKPELYKDRKLGRVSIEARFLFIALLNFADDTGFVETDVEWLAVEIFPYDGDRITSEQIQALLDELITLDRIIPYTVDGEPYAYVRHFLRHQKIDRPSAWRNPRPDRGAPAAAAAARAGVSDPYDPELEPNGATRVARRALVECSSRARDETETETETKEKPESETERAREAGNKSSEPQIVSLSWPDHLRAQIATAERTPELADHLDTLRAQLEHAQNEGR